MRRILPVHDSCDGSEPQLHDDDGDEDDSDTDKEGDDEKDREDEEDLAGA